MQPILAAFPHKTKHESTASKTKTKQAAPPLDVRLSSRLNFPREVACNVSADILWVLPYPAVA